jgi:D-galactarolactone cycloisomerase
MRIKEVKSYVLQYRLEEELGYSQQYYDRRTVHLIEVVTEEGLRGYGEAFGGGNVALVNKTIVEQAIGPLIRGMDPLDREVIWHKVYNLLRDHGQKGMALQALSGVDIALWDIAGKALGLPLYKLLGGAFRDRIPVYGYGMMLQRVPELAERFAEESRKIAAGGFKSIKMKIGLGPRQDAKLVEAVRKAVGPEIQLMVDANHCYTAREAIPLGRELERLDVFWFEEPVAPEDYQGYRDLCLALDMNIAGGEAVGFPAFDRRSVRRRFAARDVRVGRDYGVPEGPRFGAQPLRAGRESCLGVGRGRGHEPASSGGHAGPAGGGSPGAADAGVRYHPKPLSGGVVEGAAEHLETGKAK